MFENKKWSEKLKETAKKIWDIFDSERHGETKKLIELIEMALAEGREEVLNDPKAFELDNCKDCDEHRAAEPRERDEDG